MRHFIPQGYPLYVMFLPTLGDDELLGWETEQDLRDYLEVIEENITIVLGWEVDGTDRVMHPLVFNHIDTDGLAICGLTSAEILKHARDHLFIQRSAAEVRAGKLKK